MESENCDEDVDLYDDLADFNMEASLHKLETENRVLTQKVNDLSSRVSDLEALNTELNRSNKNLKANISALLKTVQKEIQRKDNTINELRQEREDLFFRRKNPYNQDTRTHRFEEKNSDQRIDSDRISNRQKASSLPETATRQNHSSVEKKIPKTAAEKKSYGDVLPTGRTKPTDANNRLKDSDSTPTTEQKPLPLSSSMWEEPIDRPKTPTIYRLIPLPQPSETKVKRRRSTVSGNNDQSDRRSALDNKAESVSSSDLARKKSNRETGRGFVRISGGESLVDPRLTRNVSGDSPVLEEGNREIPSGQAEDSPTSTEHSLQANSTSPKKRGRKVKCIRPYVKTRSSARLSAKISVQETSNEGDVSVLEALQLQEKIQHSFPNSPMPEIVSPIVSFQDNEKSLSPVRFQAGLLLSEPSSSASCIPVTNISSLLEGALKGMTKEIRQDGLHSGGLPCKGDVTGVSSDENIKHPPTENKVQQTAQQEVPKYISKDTPIVKNGCIPLQSVSSQSSVSGEHGNDVTKRSLESSSLQCEEEPKYISKDTPLVKSGCVPLQSVSGQSSGSGEQGNDVTKRSSESSSLQCEEEPKYISKDTPLVKNGCVPLQSVSSQSSGSGKHENDVTKRNSDSSALQCDFAVRRRTKVLLKIMVKTPPTTPGNTSEGEFTSKAPPKSSSSTPSDRTVSDVVSSSSHKNRETPPQKTVVVNKVIEKPSRDVPRTATQVSKIRDKSPRDYPKKAYNETLKYLNDVNNRSWKEVHRRSRSRSPPRYNSRENFPPVRSDHFHYRHTKGFRSPPPRHRHSRRDDFRAHCFNFSRRSRSLSPRLALRRRYQRKEDRVCPAKLPADRKERDMLLFGKSPDRSPVKQILPQRPVVLTVNVRRKKNVQLEDEEVKKSSPVPNPASVSSSSQLVQTPIDFRERYAEVFSNTGESSNSESGAFNSESESCHSRDLDDSYRPKKKRKIGPSKQSKSKKRCRDDGKKDL